MIFRGKNGLCFHPSKHALWSGGGEGAFLRSLYSHARLPSRLSLNNIPPPHPPLLPLVFFFFVAGYAFRADIACVLTHWSVV